MIKFKVHNKGFYLALESQFKRSRDTRGLMKSIADDLEASKEKNFTQQGREPAWKKLKQITIDARIAQKKTPIHILQISKVLRNSNSTRYNNNIAVIGTNMPYARIHQKGGWAGKGRKVRIPARPFLQLTSQEQAAMMD